MQTLTWLLIVQTTKIEIARFYGTFEEAKAYFLTLEIPLKYDHNLFDIQSLSGKSGF